MDVVQYVRGVVQIRLVMEREIVYVTKKDIKSVKKVCQGGAVSLNVERRSVNVSVLKINQNSVEVTVVRSVTRQKRPAVLVHGLNLIWDIKNVEKSVVRMVVISQARDVIHVHLISKVKVIMNAETFVVRMAVILTERVANVLKSKLKTDIWNVEKSVVRFAH